MAAASCQPEPSYPREKGRGSTRRLPAPLRHAAPYARRAAEPSHARTVLLLGEGHRPFGVKNIEPRTLIAYALIVLLVAALVGGIAYLRHNSLHRRIHRERERELARLEEKALDS